MGASRGRQRQDATRTYLGQVDGHVERQWDAEEQTSGKRISPRSNYEGFVNFSAMPLELVKLIISLVATAHKDGECVERISNGDGVH